jgi:hypothetical protein
MLELPSNDSLALLTVAVPIVRQATDTRRMSGDHSS